MDVLSALKQLKLNFNSMQHIEVKLTVLLIVHAQVSRKNNFI